MDGWIEALAFFILIAASGASEIFKRMRKSTQEKSKKNTEPAKPMSTPQSEWYTEPEPEKKGKKAEDPMTTIFKELFDVQEPEIVIVDEPPPPPSSTRNKTDRPQKGNVFDQWDFPVVEEELYEPDLPPKIEPSRTVTPPKIGPAVKEKPAQPNNNQKKSAAHDLLAGASAASTHDAFQSLYFRYGDNPLKLAVVYNEILNRPRSMHNKPMRRYT